MHHGTCVTHVPWCMSGSLICGDGENVPGIPGACAPATLRIWQEAHTIYVSGIINIHVMMICSQFGDETPAVHPEVEDVEPAASQTWDVWFVKHIHVYFQWHIYSELYFYHNFMPGRERKTRVHLPITGETARVSGHHERPVHQQQPQASVHPLCTLGLSEHRDQPPGMWGHRPARTNVRIKVHPECRITTLQNNLCE